MTLQREVGVRALHDRLSEYLSGYTRGLIPIAHPSCVATFDAQRRSLRT